MVDPNRKINLLTEEQGNFLEECEIEFGNRYTDEDKEFMDEYVNVGQQDPPVVDPWYSKSRRNFDQGSRRGRGNHGYQRFNNHRGGNNFHYDYNNDNRRNNRGGRWHSRGRGGDRGNRSGGDRDNRSGPDRDNRSGRNYYAPY